MHRFWTAVWMVSCLAFAGCVGVCMWLGAYDRAPPILIHIAAVVLLAEIAVGLCLICWSTLRQKGGLGMPLKWPRCPQCGTSGPLVRAPRNIRQFLWGGCTCAQCGTEYDKWGKSVAAEVSVE
jgi:hypothetical protein